MFNCLHEGVDKQRKAYGTNHTAVTVLASDGIPFILLDLDTGDDDSKILQPAQVICLYRLLR